MAASLTRRACALCGLAAAALYALAAQGQTPAWLADPGAQAQLSAGEVVIHSDLAPGQASVAAAILVHARSPLIWQLITHCDSVTTFVPGLKHCARLQTTADGAWSIVEHDIRYSVLMPMIHSIGRSHYQPPHRVDFVGVGGNVKAESGSWVLEAGAEPEVTTVEYSITIEPGFFVPRSVVRHSLAKELPVMLTGLRLQAERAAARAALAASPPVAR